MSVIGTTQSDYVPIADRWNVNEARRDVQRSSCCDWNRKNYFAISAMAICALPLIYGALQLASCGNWNWDMNHLEYNLTGAKVRSAASDKFYRWQAEINCKWTDKCSVLTPEMESFCNESVYPKNRVPSNWTTPFDAEDCPEYFYDTSPQIKYPDEGLSCWANGSIVDQMRVDQLQKEFDDKKEEKPKVCFRLKE